MTEKEATVAELNGSARTLSGTALGGLKVQRYFTKPGMHPFDEIEWELRTAVISNEKREKIFEQ